MLSAIKRLRIIAPPERAREDANPDDLLEGDTVEILDRPIYEVDPRTRQAKPQLQQFTVRRDRRLEPARQTNYDMPAIQNALAQYLRR